MFHMAYSRENSEMSSCGAFHKVETSYHITCVLLYLKSSFFHLKSLLPILP
jgi:hypothetical protein